MRIIDLLNKMANNEELPKKIKYDGYEWIFCKEFKDYKKEYDEYTDWLFEEYDLINCLNDEIEIIEEDKPIEKIKIENDSPTHFYIKNEFGTKCGLTRHSRIIAEKVNEIIDVVNELKKEKESE